MKTYDDKAGTHGKNPFWKSLKGTIKRWLDRERELVSLRNAVGMMSEARRGDAAEYHAMADARQLLLDERKKMLAALELISSAKNSSHDIDYCRGIALAALSKAPPTERRAGPVGGT